MSLLNHFMFTIPLIIHPSTNCKAVRSTIYNQNSHMQSTFAAIFTGTTAGGQRVRTNKPAHSQRHARDNLQYRSSKGAYKFMHSQRHAREFLWYTGIHIFKQCAVLLCYYIKSCMNFTAQLLAK